mmetsp:Transcript_49983/g.150353  ORF Transcript_49983/g.150353 Transcript_49983/m.150353 type:complete len:353 (-) Transcript_49983:952-2010(-)
MSAAASSSPATCPRASASPERAMYTAAAAASNARSAASSHVDARTVLPPTAISPSPGEGTRPTRSGKARRSRRCAAATIAARLATAGVSGVSDRRRDSVAARCPPAVMERSISLSRRRPRSRSSTAEPRARTRLSFALFFSCSLSSSLSWTLPGTRMRRKAPNSASPALSGQLSSMAVPNCTSGGQTRVGGISPPHLPLRLNSMRACAATEGSIVSHTTVADGECGNEDEGGKSSVSTLNMCFRRNSRMIPPSSLLCCLSSPSRRRSLLVSFFLRRLCRLRSLSSRRRSTERSDGRDGEGGEEGGALPRSSRLTAESVPLIRPLFWSMSSSSPLPKGARVTGSAESPTNSVS